MVALGAIEAGQELLELSADLVSRRQRLVLGEQAGPGLLGLLEGGVAWGWLAVEVMG